MEGCIDKYISDGVKNVAWLPTAADPKIHHPVKSESKYRCDVCFVGDWSAQREEWCAYLAKKFDVLVVGPWGKKIKDSPAAFRLEDQFFDAGLMRVIFSSARVVFNLHTWRDQSTTGTNPRLFEAASCGAVQIVDNKDEIRDLFKIGRDLLVFENKEDLLLKIEEILASPQRQDQIKVSARKMVIARHTYQHRMQDLLNHIRSFADDEK